MLAIFERYFGLIRAVRTHDEMLPILAKLAQEFDFNDAFVIEYERPAQGHYFLLDTNVARDEWWTTHHDRSFDTMPDAIRQRLITEPVVALTSERLATRAPEDQAAMRRFGMAELTLIPILNDGKLAGAVGLSGLKQLSPAESTALQMIAINIFAQMRSLRQISFKASPGALTSREKEVLGLSAEGLTSQQIALRLGMSPRTVNQHVDNVADKLGTRNRAHTVAEVIRHGLLN